jgi:hypothetical protein
MNMDSGGMWVCQPLLNWLLAVAHDRKNVLVFIRRQIRG